MKLKFIIIALILTVMGSNVWAEVGTGKGFVSGRLVLASGKPLQNALALFFVKQNGPAPLPERYWRVPDAEILVDTEGKFTAELLEGEYYIGAVGRESSKLFPGPPLEGDLLILVKDKSGKSKIITVSDGKTIDIGTQKGVPYRKFVRDNKDNSTSIEGLITLTDGTPVPGAYVFAFHSPERGVRPVFASEQTDAFGKYVLRVDGKGTFYLKARDTYGGGRPLNGQLMGSFGGDEPAPVSILTGNRLKGIDITVQGIQRAGGN